MEDLQGGVKVFIQKDGKMAEVEAEKRFECGRERVWFNEKNEQTQNQIEPQESSPAEQVIALEEETQEEIDERNKMWLIEKDASLEMEKEEMKNALQDMTMRVALQENRIKEMEDRQGAIQATLARVCESVQRLNNFTEEATQ